MVMKLKDACSLEGKMTNLDSGLKSMQEMQEMQVRSLGWGDLLEKEIATHSSILAWRIP